MSRLSWIVVAVAAVALPAAGAAALIVFSTPGKKNQPVVTTISSAPQRFSLPLLAGPSILAVAKHDRDVLVGLAARPGEAEIAVLRAETLLPTAQLKVLLDGRPVAPAACGPGCSRIHASLLAGSPSMLSVRTGSHGVAFVLPARLPPSGSPLLSRARATMDALRAFRFTESLSSGGAPEVTEVDAQAPNRVRLQTASGFRSVIIGKSRWDYRGGRWQKSTFPGLNVSQLLMWHAATNPRVVGQRGSLTELAAFGLQPVPAWFLLWVEPSGRVVQAEMVAPSHFMVHRYRAFNGPVSIKPPGRK